MNQKLQSRGHKNIITKRCNLLNKSLAKIKTENLSSSVCLRDTGRTFPNYENKNIRRFILLKIKQGENENRIENKKEYGINRQKPMQNVL